MTLLSVVCPSKNRPKLLESIIDNFVNYSVKDVELLIIDNSSDPIYYLDPDIIKSGNIKYVRPSKYLSMCDNWNYGLSLATGDYVTFLMDKSLFLPHSLECIVKILNSEFYDIVSWRNLKVIPKYPDRRDYNQQCSYYGELSSLIDYPEVFDPAEELLRRKRLGSHHGQSEFQVTRGRILTSAYHKSLIAKVKSKYGDLFHPMSPDYTSTTLALSLASKRCIDLNIPMITSTKFYGNGAHLLARDIAKEDFYKENYIPLMDLPLKKLSGSISNYVARDVYIDEFIVKGGCDYKDLYKINFIRLCIGELFVIKGNYIKRSRELILLTIYLFRLVGSRSLMSAFKRFPKFFIRRVVNFLLKSVNLNQKQIYFNSFNDLFASEGLKIFTLYKLGIISYFENPNSESELFTRVKTWHVGEGLDNPGARRKLGNLKKT